MSVSTVEPGATPDSFRVAAELGAHDQLLQLGQISAGVDAGAAHKDPHRQGAANFVSDRIAVYNPGPIIQPGEVLGHIPKAPRGVQELQQAPSIRGDILGPGGRGAYEGRI